MGLTRLVVKLWQGGACRYDWTRIGLCRCDLSHRVGQARFVGVNRDDRKWTVTWPEWNRAGVACQLIRIVWACPNGRDGFGEDSRVGVVELGLSHRVGRDRAG